MFERFQQVAEAIFKDARREGRLIENSSDEDLRKLALEAGARKTKYGNVAVDSEPMNRAAMFTKNNVDFDFGREEWDLVEQARLRLGRERLVSIDVEVGDGSEGITARLIVPQSCVHVAYGGRKLFKPTTEAQAPTHQVIMFTDEEHPGNKKRLLPQKKITIRSVYSPDGRMIKLVRNSDYTGEWKKGVFSAEDWRVKQSGKAIFLHAGLRQDYLEMAHGGWEIQNSLFAALSANGKTTLVARVLGTRKIGERAWLIQDDGGTLRQDGSFLGFEAGGLYIKTDGLNIRDQIESFYGVLRPASFLENVAVDAQGEIDFYNAEKTTNGRAIVERRDFMHASREIGVEEVHNLFIITRGPLIPAIAKLTPEQATAFMILGQSMESSAGDPTKAGEIKNEFFYDPFLIGDRAGHANLFYEIIKGLRIRCYLLNTGEMGEGERRRKITLQETLGILDSTLRGGLEDWVEAEGTGLLVPASVRSVDSVLFHPVPYFYTAEEFEKKQSALAKHRAEIMEQYPELDRQVRKVFLK